MSSEQPDIIPGMPRDQQAELIQRSNFNQEEVKALVKLYKVYDKSAKAIQGIPLQTYIDIPDFSGHPFISRLAEMFLIDPLKPLIFAEQFVTIASFLSSKAPVEQKRKLAFRMLDVNEDGSLAYDEIYRMYKMLYHSSLSDDYIAALVLAIMERPEMEKPGFMTYNDFVKLVPDLEIQSRFTVDIQPR